MLRQLPRLISAQKIPGSSAFCLRSFSTHHIPLQHLYRQMHFNPSSNSNEMVNFLEFLTQTRTEENIRHFISRVGSENINAVIQPMKQSDLKNISSLALSKFLETVEGNSFRTLYKSPEDLILFYNTVGFEAFKHNFPPSLFSEIITDKNALTKVMTALRGSDKDKLIESMGITTIKEIVLKDEDKENITPVLEWLRQQFSPMMLGEYKNGKKSMFSWITGEDSTSNQCPIDVSLLIPMIDNFEHLKQVFAFFDGKEAMVVGLTRQIEKYIATIFDFDDFSKLLKEEKAISAFNKIFNSCKFKELIIETMKKVPEVDYCEYVSWLPKRFAEFEDFQLFENLKREAICPASFRIGG